MTYSALKLYEEMDHKRAMVHLLNSIGSMYTNRGNDSLGLSFFLRALAIKEAGMDKASRSILLCNIGKNYMRRKEYLTALDYYQRALEDAKAVDSKSNEASSLRGIGRASLLLGKPDTAITYYNRALKIEEEFGEIKEKSTTRNLLGVVYQKKGNHNSAIKHARISLTLAQEADAPLYISNAAKTLYNSYKATNNFQKALEMYELHEEMQDTLKGRDNVQALIRFEFEQKALRDSLAQVEQTLNMQMAHQAELHQKDQTRNILVAIGILALILAIGFWARNRYVQRTNAQLQAAKERAERSERFKEQFLANMSHEIRTPMHAISGMVNILKRNDHPATQNAFLDAMDTSADNLLVLLNDILDLSKVEAGKLEVETIPMAPAEVVDNVCQILQFKAAEKGLKLNYHIAEEIPQYVIGDPTRLNQILTNLAGNAIKFTEKGEVNIRLKRKSDFLLFEVQDTGIGIPEDKLQSIFDAFNQADRTTTRNFGGTGLGLNISRQLVELQGGNIWAESELGKGSTFFVSLPLILIEGQEVASSVVSEAQLAEMAHALKGIKVLIADDNEFNQMVIQDDLAYYIQDPVIKIVPNGKLAVEQFQQTDYDLVLMDIQMPEMDGYEATFEIREWEKKQGRPSVPIIAMTASVLKSEINLCLEVGMDNYIPKPYKVEELIGTIFKETQT